MRTLLLLVGITFFLASCSYRVMSPKFGSRYDNLDYALPPDEEYGRGAADKSSTTGWSYSDNENGGFEQGAYSADGQTPKLGEHTANQQAQQQQDSIRKSQMLIYNAQMGLAVDGLDSTAKKIADLAETFGGYASTIGTDRTIIRVPADQLEAAMNAISEMGKERWRDVAGEDVGLEYHDLGIRLENARKARARYLELLSLAHTVEEIIKVEKELERLNGEIDRIVGRMNYLRNHAQYSTITVMLYERQRPGLLAYPFVGLYHGIKWLFVRG